MITSPISARRFDSSTTHGRRASGDERKSRAEIARRYSTQLATKMKLVEPSERWESEFLEMAAEWNTFGETRYAAALNDFRAYLRNIEGGRREALPAGKVPGTEYWLEDGGK